ncbi:hypothetical protein [Actinoplanes sp. NPDC051851]|uniref:WXG100 family type VII secretion target n=1 Tax=Actinoplanes sp. NPDC051851 TaxID=3154753 RepID=UPI00341A796E
MPAEVITVDFAALQSASDQLSVKARALESTMDTLVQSLNPVKETWYASGSSAGQAAEQSETRLRAAIADVIGVIAQFSAKVAESRENQLLIENTNTGRFN